MRAIAGTGLYADRLRFLGAVAHEVPACVRELAELLAESRAALLRTLTADGVAELTTRTTAAEALPSGWWFWGGHLAEALASTRPPLALVEPPPRPLNLAAMAPEERLALVRDPPELLRRLLKSRAPAAPPRSTTPPSTGDVDELNAAVAAWASRWNLARDGAGGWMLATAGLTLHRWAERGALLSRTVFEPLPRSSYVPEREPFRPFSKASSVRARSKRAPGADVELLVDVEPWHLAALALWQVGNTPPSKVAERWAELEKRAIPPTWATVTEKLRSLARGFELPERPAPPRGRPRRAGR